MAAKGVIEKGSWWNIGNGRNVNIWKDRWIPIPEFFKVISPRPQDTDREKVLSLLDLERGTWDINLVRRTFLHYEVVVILGIPISPSPPNDSLIWAWTQNGNFMMRSVYQVACNWLKDSKHKINKGVSNSSKMKAL